MAYRNGVRDGEKRCGAGRVRDTHLGWLASPRGPVPAGRSFSAEPATGLGGKRCPGSRGRRSTGWCGRCCPGDSSDRMSCCCDWRIRSYATSGRAVPTKDAAPPAVKAGWSHHPKRVVVVLVSAACWALAYRHLKRLLGSRLPRDAPEDQSLAHRRR